MKPQLYDMHILNALKVKESEGNSFAVLPVHQVRVEVDSDI